MNIHPDEICISEGAKSDCGNIGDIFSIDNTVAVCDPVYPVYVDTNAMAGREQLKAWVDYANANGSIILYDSAYEVFISDPALPHSIFEIEGARTCAIEFRSFSKTAGFTGTRCAYTVIPQELERGGAKLNALWDRRRLPMLRRRELPLRLAEDPQRHGSLGVFRPAAGSGQCGRHPRRRLWPQRRGLCPYDRLRRRRGCQRGNRAYQGTGLSPLSSSFPSQLTLHAQAGSKKPPSCTCSRGAFCILLYCFAFHDPLLFLTSRTGRPDSRR